MKGLAIFVLVLLSGCATVPDTRITVIEPESEAISSTNLLVDVGLETEGGFAPFLRKGCSLPCVMTARFRNARDNSEQILLTVSRENVQATSARVPLGSYRITGFSPAPAGTSVKYVEFRADTRGISIAPSAQNSERLVITRTAP